MPVVYLDTSHLAVLAEGVRARSGYVSIFVQGWRERKCELAVSLPHLQELVRYGEPWGRSARYELFKMLGPVHLGLATGGGDAWTTLGRREIAWAILLKVAEECGVSPPPQRRSWPAFPTVLSQASEIAGLAAVENAEFKWASEAFYDGLRRTAEAQQLSPRNVKARLRSFPNSVPSDEVVTDALASVEAEMDRPEFRAHCPAWLDEGAGQKWLERARALVRRAISRVAELGAREAIREQTDASDGDEVATAIRRNVFQQEVQEVVRGVIQADEDYLDGLARSLPIEACPGTWLAIAAEREVEIARGYVRPNDWFDCQHLGYLPYVDVLTADADAAENCAKVLRRTGALPPRVAGCRYPIRAARDSAEIAAALWSALDH